MMFSFPFQAQQGRLNPDRVHLHFPSDLYLEPQFGHSEVIEITDLLTLSDEVLKDRLRFFPAIAGRPRQVGHSNNPDRVSHSDRPAINIFPLGSHLSI